ncbi:MAG: hypothetical protein D3913_07055 [Candidatus Electrothrix sp. LOE1_4_5]|nr:hypothetical protein [Candidatus Electrothrix gigas]
MIKKISCLFCFFVALGTLTQHAVAMEPVDSLSLSLVGTMLNQQNGNKAVILDETEQQQYILGEGEKVTESIVVQKVERGRVVLLRNGQEEVLFLKNRKGRGTPDTAAPRTPLADLMPPPPPPPPAPAPAPAPL